MKKIIFIIAIIYCFRIDSVYAQYAMAESSIEYSLPVHLTSFEVIQEKSKILVTWITQYEENAKGYILERKINFQDSFTTLSSYLTNNNLIIMQNSNEEKKYEFLDELQLHDVSVSYRLKIEYINGSTEILAVKTIVLDNLNEDDAFQFIVSPNPFNNELTIKASQFINEPVSIKIYNTLGQNLVSMITSEFDHSNSINLNLRTFSTGIYFIKLRTANLSQTKKVILLR